MSDLKMSCPACDAWTSAVGIAMRDGDPCPYCGLPAAAGRLIEEARARGVKGKVLRQLADAEIRAAKAEAENARMRAALSAIAALAVEGSPS